MNIAKKLSAEFKVSETIANNIISLVDEGNTIPFIARYRKEMTNSMDDQTLREFCDKLTSINNFIEKRDDIIKKITDQGKMTDEILAALNKSKTHAELDDIYLPFKQSKRTRATIAIEKGLEPLADIIFAQDKSTTNIMGIAAEYINEEKKVLTADDAIAGAMDIIAANISNNAAIRKKIREFTNEDGILMVDGVKKGDIDIDGSVYEMYKEI